MPPLDIRLTLHSFPLRSVLLHKKVIEKHDWKGTLEQKSWRHSCGQNVNKIVVSAKRHKIPATSPTKKWNFLLKKKKPGNQDFFPRLIQFFSWQIKRKEIFSIFVGWESFQPTNWQWARNMQEVHFMVCIDLPRSKSEMKWGRGLSTMVEHTPQNQEVVSLNPAGCWDFFSFYLFLLSLSCGVSLTR